METAQEFDVSTPEGLKNFLLAEAEFDDGLYAEDMLKGFLQENWTKTRPKGQAS